MEVGVAVELEDAADDGNGPADEDRDELGLECMVNASSVLDGVDEFLGNGNSRFFPVHNCNSGST